MAQLSFVSSDKDKSPRGKEVKPGTDTTIIKVGHAAGIEISATCGERGRCRACRVKILSGQVESQKLPASFSRPENDVKK